ncbi:TolC family protein [Hydrogenimonas cancrithermarum]|uniref:Transporter n=1 Tax=Hydrogenimonas cancrithermarum TaxID=2993563 RepID=A0ABN6WSJ0_9BACT|nr:TolC family protein [Hydrogenimonas cancrithermarum]BDY11922.1 transporter [Hydrogenimonas cancrithermarum]
MKKITILLTVGLVGLHAELLTLGSCIDKALQTHPDVRAFMLKVKEQHEGVKVQKGAWRPQVSAYAEYDPQRTYVMPQNGQFHTIDDDGWTAGISVTQKIYDFSKTSHTIESSKIKHEISTLSFEEAKALMRYRIRIAYAQLLVQKAALTAREKDLDAKRALYEQAKALVEQGLKTRADESRFLSAVRQAEDALAVARAAYKKAKISLEQYIGEPIAENTTFEEGILSEKTVPAIVTDEETVLENNLQLQIAKKSEDASRELYKSKLAEHYGSLDVVAEASHFDTLSRYDTTLFGIRYAVPIYSGGRLSAQAQQTKISKMIAAEEKESKRRAILEEIKALLADLEEAEKRIEARRSQTVSAEETKVLIEARYEEGLSTYMEVLDAEAVWLDAKLGLLDAFYTRLNRLYRLEYLNAK